MAASLMRAMARTMHTSRTGPTQPQPGTLSALTPQAPMNATGAWLH